MKLLKILPLSLSLLLISLNRVYAQQPSNPAPKVGNNENVAKFATEGPVLFGNILAAVTFLAAFAAFVMIFWGGFRYILAQGDPKAVQAARGTVTWAVVGLVMIVVSWLVLVFIEQFTGVNVTKFCIGTTCPIT